MASLWTALVVAAGERTSVPWKRGVQQCGLWSPHSGGAQPSLRQLLHCLPQSAARHPSHHQDHPCYHTLTVPWLASQVKQQKVSLIGVFSHPYNQPLLSFFITWDFCSYSLAFFVIIEYIIAKNYVLVLNWSLKYKMYGLSGTKEILHLMQKLIKDNRV